MPFHVGSNPTLAIMAKTGGKKSKSANNKPARLRYWLSGRLRRRKVKNLMRYYGLTKAQAEKRWEKDRGGRRMSKGTRKR